MLRRLLSVLGYEPKRAHEPESVRRLKRLAEQLNEKAARFRTVAGRAVLIDQRIEFLEADLRTWAKRAEAVAAKPLLMIEVARVCGRLEGQLQEARAEIATLMADEAHLRNLLTSGRRDFAVMLAEVRGWGHDVSECLLYVDLTRPERVADTDLLADDDREFVARVIDQSGIH